MELERNDVWVGLFILVSVVVVVATLVAIAQGRFGEAMPVVARFDAISGIQEGTPVVLRGYRVGEVKRIDFVSDPEVRFDVHMVIAGDVLLRRGTRAVITSTNMIGENYVLLDVAEARGDTLRAGDVIAGESAQAMGDLMGRVNGVLAGAQVTVDRLAAALRSATLEEGEEGTDVPFTSDRLPIAEVSETTRELRDLLRNMNRLVASAEPGARMTVELANAELREARWTTAEAGSLLAENRAQARDLLVNVDSATRHLDSLLIDIRGIAAENRDEIAGTLAELERTSANLSRLSGDLADHPWKLLFR